MNDTTAINGMGVLRDRGGDRRKHHNSTNKGKALFKSRFQIGLLADLRLLNFQSIPSSMDWDTQTNCPNQ